MSKNRYRNPGMSDEGTLGLCAVDGCKQFGNHWMWITIRGYERWKRFCKEHEYDEYKAETAHRAGL